MTAVTIRRVEDAPAPWRRWLPLVLSAVGVASVGICFVVPYLVTGGDPNAVWPSRGGWLAPILAAAFGFTVLVGMWLAPIGGLLGLYDLARRSPARRGAAVVAVLLGALQLVLMISPAGQDFLVWLFD